MLAYVLEAARLATGSRPIVVYSPATAGVRSVFADEAEFVLQPEPRGTGDAVRAAMDALPKEADELVVLSGDTPQISEATVRAVVDGRRAAAAGIALATVELDAPTGYGRIVRGPDDSVVRIVEEKDATLAEREIVEVNGGLYAFAADPLRRYIADIAPSPASGEIYLTDVVSRARAEGASVVPIRLPRGAPDLDGVNDRVQLAAAESALRERIRERHMRAGVTLRDPPSAFIDASVEIAEDVMLGSDVILRGATRIGRDTVIEAGSQIVDSVIGERCRVWASVLESCEVEDEVQIGPFAHLRPGASIGRGAKLGNFAEVKKSRIGAGTQQHHFSYIGDATVGRDVNIGAGTITANYDGHAKHATVIGDGAFIGSDTIIRAPVTIGEGAVTGAASLVTRDVPAHKLALGIPARIRELRAEPADTEASRGADPSHPGGRGDGG